MNTTLGKWIAGAAILVTTNIAAAAGYAQGHIGDFGYDSGRVLYLYIDPVKQYTPRGGGVPQAPVVTLNSDNQCQDGSYAMVNLADAAAVDKNEIILLLTAAEMLKKPITIETAGCVNLSGWTYPKIVSVGYP